ncbi:Scramblase-domain-containing protein [Didymella exigua CBS 183.55]|uniref:Scramblase-domain-containing protein n=1 Tax=Didymella exigua CBS 183.55 TaxID=1150837 RepID=A0A6A5R9T8_9PLEO|nr:Scramblase-domain-containing protein [Didymella exigua CBS 183.55]KAF1924985.1 Scramblase-domain-containing protein [Didymella exigua CBS 183.55]
MLPTAARWSLRLPREQFRAFATRGTPPPPGPRGRLPRRTPPQRNEERAARSSGQSATQSNQPSQDASSASANGPSRVEAVSNALATTPDSQNPLVTPVHLLEDPHAVLKQSHPAMRILDNSAIVIQRQLEMMNVLMGFEQANRYVIMDPHGNHIGYLAERDHGIGSAMARQMFKTHRSFTTHVFDRDEKEVLRFHRPFSWINSQISVYDAVGDGGACTSSTQLQGTSTASIVKQTSANVSNLDLSDMRIIGATEQDWAPLRRKYNMFLARDLAAASSNTPQIAPGSLPLSDSKETTVAEGDNRKVGMLQFARVDERFLSWDFSLMSQDDRLLGSVNRNFGGFAREIFTDTGVYALRMDAAALSQEPSHMVSQTGQGDPGPGMTLDQRAVMLATAVSIDFDYFSRHSGSGGMMWPIWMPWFGGAGEAGGAVAGRAAAGEAGAAGVAGVGTTMGAAGESGVLGEAAAGVRGLGAAEGAATGAATMAGYEALQRGRGDQQADDMAPQANDPYQPPEDQQQGGPGEDDVWGQNGDPWADQRGQNQEQDVWGGDQGGDGGGGEGGDSDWGDWF